MNASANGHIAGLPSNPLAIFSPCFHADLEIVKNLFHECAPPEPN